MCHRPAAALLFASLTAVVAVSCGSSSKPYQEEREPCAERDPLRNLYFGDLHVHTGFSFDAYAYETRVTPWDAYRFAQGEEILLAPLDGQGRGTRPVRLARPLDFAMVSEHAEFLGEVELCTTPGSVAYETDPCETLRDRPENGVTLFGVQTALGPRDRLALCPPGEPGCIEPAARRRWRDVQQAAEDHYDRTATCGFVSFVGYEYTATPGVSNFHRHVLFGNEKVPPLPITFYESELPEYLWAALDEQCLGTHNGCDTIVIAHNSNLSNGNTFTPPTGLSEAEQRQAAELRARVEGMVEIFQHKGDMECRNGLSGIGGDDDPLCDFEKVWPDPIEDCGDEVGSGGMRLGGCVSRLDFVRNVFKEGLREQQRLGVNPYKFGVIASTDSHNAIAGMVEERGFPGHVGTIDDTPAERLGLG